ncbi:hypothetical protein DFQ30_007718 [Apophysomyces sp. BC1015]|nr:hypothetical protein DFQ30_007718 [Apophysomyces sp. BC1015]
MQVMVQLLPVFVTNPPDYTIEDSYVYNCTAPILKSIFSCEPLVRVEWASCHLSKRNAKANKDKTNFKINKPEFAAVILFVCLFIFDTVLLREFVISERYSQWRVSSLAKLGDVSDLEVSTLQHCAYTTAANIKAPNSWISVVVSEFKRPVFSPYLESDLVKIDIEMRTMLNDLVRLGIFNPLVGGILIQRRHITTFQYDIVAPRNDNSQRHQFLKTLYKSRKSACSETAQM